MMTDKMSSLTSPRHVAMSRTMLTHDTLQCCCDQCPHLGTPPRTTAATQLVWQQPGAAGVSWPALGNQTAAGGQNLGTLGRNELSKLPNIYSFCTVSCFDKSRLHSPWQGCVSGARRCWWWWVRLAKCRLFWVRSSHSRPGSCYLRLHAHSLPPTKLVLHFKS